MAKIVFQSNEAKDHFAKVVEHAILNDTYFTERGLHGRLEYLRKYGDEGKEQVRKDDTYIQWRILFGVGYTIHEVNIVWQTRTWDRNQAGSVDDRWSEWENFLVGGLIGHSDGTWGTHT